MFLCFVLLKMIIIYIFLMKLLYLTDLQKETSLSCHCLAHFSRFAFIAAVNLGFLAGRQALKSNSFNFLRMVRSEAFTLASWSCDFITFVVANLFSRQIFFKHLSDRGVKIGFLPHLFFLLGLNSSPDSITFFMRRTLASETFNLRDISRFENVFAFIRAFTSAFLRGERSPFLPILTIVQNLF